MILYNISLRYTSQASKRAELGKQILDLIHNGQPVSDKLLILLLVDAIRLDLKFRNVFTGNFYSSLQLILF